MIPAAKKRSSRKKCKLFSFSIVSFPFLICSEIWSFEMWAGLLLKLLPSHPHESSTGSSFPSDVEMKMVSALSSNLRSSCRGSSSWGDLLWPRSHEGSKPEICHAPEAAVPVRLMFYRAARCSAFPYYGGRSCCSWEDLDFWQASGLSGASAILPHLSRELHARPGTPRRHDCQKVDLYLNGSQNSKLCGLMGKCGIILKMVDFVFLKLSQD